MTARRGIFMETPLFSDPDHDRVTAPQSAAPVPVEDPFLAPEAGDGNDQPDFEEPV
jgi:hypothetical protein